MGRLFWKFFAFVWLAQLTGIIAVASLFWLAERRTHAAFDDVAPAPVFAVTLSHDADRRGGVWSRAHAARYWLHPMPPPIPTMATLAASIVTALLLAGYVAKPIRSLRMALEAAAAGDLDRRIAPQLGARHDELADLGR
ncbi:MAG: ATP-binding region, ATPase-like:Histidine kinase, region:Histidine kinase N-terminal, partial [Gammaproteobacteria bacterium]|nr:ATP-binding region, ATPase-like:Histidine kinase, region:Histidine kinase N-terminal [Gammaproteobacteria bacterium]